MPQSKNTLPELRFRKILRKRTRRYRLHVKNLPGTPDIVFPKSKIVIFVNGCYWHSHECQNTRQINGEYKKTSNSDYNLQRDEEVNNELEEMGYLVFTVWECGTDKEFDRIAATIVSLTKDRALIPHK